MNSDAHILFNAFVSFILKGHESDFRKEDIVFNSYDQAYDYAIENKKKYSGYFNIYVNDHGEIYRVYCSYEEEKKAKQQATKEKKNSKKYETKIIEKEFSKLINIHKCMDLFPTGDKFFLRWLTPEEIEKIRESKLTHKFFYKMKQNGLNGYICYIRDDFRKNKDGERAISIREV